MTKAQKVEVFEMQRTSNLVVEYDLPNAAIKELAERFAPLEITDTASYKMVVGAIAEVRTLRTTVEKKRVELKRDALEYGRKVDSEAKRITAMLTPIENELIGKKQIEDNRKEAERQEKIRIEQERIACIREKISGIQRMVLGLNGLTSKDIHDLAPLVAAIVITPEEYAEFTLEAEQAKGEVKAAIAKAYDERVKLEEEEEAARKAESERLEQVRKEQEAEAKRPGEKGPGSTRGEAHGTGPAGREGQDRAERSREGCQGEGGSGRRGAKKETSSRQRETERVRQLPA